MLHFIMPVPGQTNRCPEKPGAAHCGGSWGYRELLDVLADPAHPEHAERREWLGEDFDPDDFHPDIADATLATRFSRA
jgi:Plasmid pRiA4b ORF-3-like protein